MSARNSLGISALTAMGVVLFSGHMSVVHAADTDDVAAASQGFYAALAVIDDGSAMANVWAQTPDVTFIGPRSTSTIVGWDAQRKYWINANKLFAKRDVTLSDQHLYVDGSVAWELGQETADVELADGTARKTGNLVTNVYEKIDGRWLMVSHHAQPIPK